MTSVVDAAQLAGTVSHDLSIWGLFWQADLIVKAVIMALLAASVWCWCIIFQKMGMLKKLNDRADKFEEAFWSGEALDKLYARVQKSKEDPLLNTFKAGMEEWHLSNENNGGKKVTLQAGLQQRIERSMAITITREMDKLERYMTFLANTGSSAPFIGLFGTVWGIMNSFSSIAMTQNTSLAVVAPGIAEALFATALGLVAAIPAVISYNKFSNDLNRYADRLEAFSSEFSAILSRYFEKQKAAE
ncbi:MAG: protein TolQ [Micavibrio sp.]|nr:protein TolQ [Micavibrio sp.]|tara:strand:- start:5415 stop:6149 length:735 start_codon:yes stop_codon:yes gene_type:complete